MASSKTINANKAFNASRTSRATEASKPANPSSLFRRLLLGFSAVILLVFVAGFVYVVLEARATQRFRTDAENRAHTHELLLMVSPLADSPDRLRAAAVSAEAVRVEMFRELDYRSHVRVRIWRGDALLYNSMPDLPDALPLPDSPQARQVNGWVRAVERDAATGLVVERSHEVDDRWMFTYSGVSFLLRSTIFSLPLLMLPAWLIVGIGLRPLRRFARDIEHRSDQDLTPLPPSDYRELSPLVESLNSLMARLRKRIEHEHEFLTDAAHELKTPLAAIQLNAHLLQTRSADADPQRHAEVSEGLRIGLARATHLVNQLLALERARAEPGAERPPALSIATLVRERLAAAVPLALQRGIDIDFHADDECVRPVHQESLFALVDNLVGNAIKYSPSGGRIEVRLHRETDGCRLTVLDEGPGIPPALRQRVFERFYRLPGQEQPGSGLGLAIAERAAHRNDARIELAPGPDGGGLNATVHFGGAFEATPAMDGV
ncbi:ATP-binding protein [Roseateles chitinivorans]|uniref:ATP-binding protein n=1 Tax=Roseateles chitinivorans TaxID=2917965 RepID=UPI003D67FC32